MADNDFELEIGAGGVPGEYVVRVLRAPVGGEPRAALRVDVEDWLHRRAELEDVVLRSAVTVRRRLRAVEQPLREAGSELFDSVFTGEIASVYCASLAEAGRQERTLRVVLKLTEPELTVLPWEALYDASRRAYVCRKDEVVRHVSAPYTIRPVPVVPPLRILGLVASPRGLAALATEDEQDRLQSALAGPIAEGLIELAWVEPASWSRVHERLLGGPWHVVHFIGHGDYDADTDEGTLALVGDDGRANWVEASRMVDLLTTASPRPRLVVLNSCASAQGGEQELFSATAATLVHSGIAAVAAMQFSITDRAAIEFPRGFYTALVNGKTVDEAVRSGRTEILGIGRDTLEWVTPVLYVSDTSRLFDIRPRRGTPEPSTADRSHAAHDDEALPTLPRTPDPPVARVSDAPRTQRAGLGDDPAWADALEAFYAGRWADAVERLRDLRDRHPDEERVAARLADAQQQCDLADWAAEAEVAIDQHRWKTALDALERILAVDPTYRGAKARHEHVRHQLRRHEVLEEIRSLSAAGRWQAVIDAGSRLSELDPDTSDVDGLLAEARRELSEADLAKRYRNAIDLLDQHRWQAAIVQLETIARNRRDYRDIGGLLATARQRQQASAEGSSSTPSAPPPALPPPSGTRLPGPVPAAAGVFVPEARTIDVGQWVLCVAFSPDGALLAGGSRQRVRVWNLRTGRIAWEKKTGGWSGNVNAVAFSPDGTRLATADGDNTSRVWDATTGEELLAVQHETGVGGVAFSPDGTRLATGSADHAVRLWDSATGEELLTVRHGGSLSFTQANWTQNFWEHGVAFSPDGTRVVAISTGNAVRVWDATTGAELLTVQHPKPVFGVAFGPDGTRLATASADNTARLWDARTGAELLSVGHSNKVARVVFDPVGSRFATAAADNTARVWDASTGAQLYTVQHANPVLGVAFGPDGTRLATASSDKTVRISELDRTLT